jgi:hypothetical protein
MIADADAASIDSDVPRVQGKVDFEEFEAMMSCHNASKSATHWRTILEKVPLVKGAKKSLKMLQDLNTKKSLTAEAQPTQEKRELSSPLPPSPFPSIATPLSDRDEAIRNAKWSLTILAGFALFRRLVFKI